MWYKCETHQKAEEGILLPPLGSAGWKQQGKVNLGAFLGDFSSQKFGFWKPVGLGGGSKPSWEWDPHPILWFFNFFILLGLGLKV